MNSSDGRKVHRSRKSKHKSTVAVDVFCGAGGLTRGLLDAGIPVVAGYDIDEACRYPYEYNNAPTQFYNRSVTELTGDQLLKHYSRGDIRILVGCAPCVTFSKYTQGLRHKKNPKWSLLRQFARLVRELKPDIVSMENVPELQRHSVFNDFLNTLAEEGFHFPLDPKKRIVYCPDYGIPQQRSRLVIMASRLGPIELIPPTHRPSQYRSVLDAFLPNDKPAKATDVQPLDGILRIFL